jgi:hypothetical protein
VVKFYGFRRACDNHFVVVYTTTGATRTSVLIDIDPLPPSFIFELQEELPFSSFQNRRPGIVKRKHARSRLPKRLLSPDVVGLSSFSLARRAELFALC